MQLQISKSRIVLAVHEDDIHEHTPDLVPYLAEARYLVDLVLQRELQRLRPFVASAHFEYRDGTVQPRLLQLGRLFGEAIIAVAARCAGVVLPADPLAALRLIGTRDPALGIPMDVVDAVESHQTIWLGIAAIYDLARPELRLALTADEQNALRPYVPSMPQGAVFAGSPNERHRHLNNAQRKLLGLTQGVKKWSIV